MERVMLIVWRWDDFIEGNLRITADLLDQKRFQSAVLSPDSHLGILYDVFQVCDQRPDGSFPPIKPNSSVVRTHIQKKIGDIKASSFQYLNSLIKYLKNDTNEVFVFLHRKDGFGDKEVLEILKEEAANRCFLIGAGSDDIYFHEKNNRGLLGAGCFYSRELEKKNPSIEIADLEHKIVYSYHFDKVWSYYKHEFYTKIFEIKEDLLSYFYNVYPNNEIWTYSKIRTHLKQEAMLKLRISSFIDDNCHCLKRDEKEELAKNGKSQGKSYEFDDLRANLSQHADIGEEYTEVSKCLYRIFQKENATSNKQTINEILEEIEDRFSILLQAI